MGAKIATPLSAETKRADAQRSAHNVPPLGTCAPYASPIEKLHRAVGNRAMISLLRSRVIQPKLTVSDPDDEYEREADRVADHVMRLPDERSVIQPKCGCDGTDAACTTCKEKDSLVQRSSQTATRDREAGAGLESYVYSSNSAGQSLSSSSRAYFEPRFRSNLSAVRLHTDQQAATAAKQIGAEAFTKGSDIYFGSGKYQPGTSNGDRLLAHELVHTIQQSEDVQHIARQPTLGSREIPTDLQTSPAVRMMTIEALQKRYDRVMQTLAQFDQSTAETAGLDQQLEAISNELARRVALEQRRTFDQRVIDQMKAYLVENAKTEKDSCIICMNKGIQKLLEDPNQRLTPESVDATMELLRQSGRASQAREIGFNDRRGRLTRGGGRPHQLRESVSAAVLEMVAKDIGWSVFGMSLMDGLHSVLLTVDTHDPAQPRIYWSDQWKSKKGWKEYTREALDQEITRLIQGWWDEQPEGKKHNLVIRLWRLRQ